MRISRLINDVYCTCDGCTTIWGNQNFINVKMCFLFYRFLEHSVNAGVLNNC